jgi:tetratricopeptide (TPR) repeat protein|tara:strand:+ start:21792 stop:22532 length:741 start_codon:yes stop_codon:yes gene_type:complete
MRTIYFFLSFCILAACSNHGAEDAKTLNDEGVSLMDKEEYDKASVLFLQALKKKDLPKDLNAGILRNLSLLYSFQNEKDSALHYAKLGFEIAEKNSYFFYLNKAEYELLTDKIELAKDNYERAKELKPDEMAIYNSLGMIYSGSYGEEFINYKEALTNNLKAYEISPREPLAEALATSYMNLEQYKESIPLWEKLIGENPAKMEYHFQLGVAFLFSGREEEGEKKIDYAAERDENCRAMLEEMLAE